MKANVHIALLRGINVGGHNKISMKDLVALFEEAGCRRVRSYIQSGNVIFEGNSALALTMPDTITTAIRENMGLEIPVCVRSGKEWAKVVANNPFLLRDHDPDHLAVGFLAGFPELSDVAQLDPDRSPPDEFCVIGRDVYLSIQGSAAKTKLTNAWFDSRLGTVSTVRNWRTCMQLHAMAEDG